MRRPARSASPRRRAAFTAGTFLLGALLLLPVAPAAADNRPILIQTQPSTATATQVGVTAFQICQDGILLPGRRPAAHIGDTVRIGVTNLSAWLGQLQADGVIRSATKGNALAIEQLGNFRLFLGGHLLATLRPTGYFEDNPAWYPGNTALQTAAKDRVWLDFVLARDSTREESRRDWQDVLLTPGVCPQMTLAAGIYQPETNTAHVLSSWVRPGETQSDLEFRLVRFEWNAWAILCLTVLGGALVLFLVLAARTGIVRDTTQPIREDGLPPYSLSRCQMAFWFFFTAWAFFFLWIITGRGDIDTINGTVLTLIGISAGTALASAIISNGQTDAAQRSAVPPRNYPAEIHRARAALERSTANKAAAPALEKQAKALDTLKRDLREWRRRNRWLFLTDILSETAASGNLITFHRFQTAAWTLILGIIFLSDVLTKLTMPTFDPTLLVLMGISSGTYLGFRLPSAGQV